jgi:octaprenyl-diphosphate synthase
LLHDDVIDGAQLRRGKPVANSIWKNSSVVLTGDFLLARGLSIAAATKKPSIIKIVADITENMSQGEIEQLLRKGDLSITEEEYRKVIWRKTAVLFQGACRISARLANSPKREEKAISDYGNNLGIAFQMVDDLLDYTLDTKVLGKGVGADLKEGKVTLPVIHALKAADSKDRLKIESIIKNKKFSGSNFKSLIKLLEKYGGISYTEECAKYHVKQAKESLLVFKPSETRNILEYIADYTLLRNS